MKYVLFIIGLLFQIWSFSQSGTKIITRAAALYTIYNNTIYQPSLVKRQADFSKVKFYNQNSYKPNINFTSTIQPIAYTPKFIMPKKSVSNINVPNLDESRLLLLQDTVVKSIIQKIQSDKPSVYSSDNSFMSDYDKLVNSVNPMDSKDATELNESGFRSFENGLTTNQLAINGNDSNGFKKNSVSGLFNLYSICAGGIEPIAYPQFGYSRMVLTTNM